MRFLADENVERQLVAALRDAGHDVEYIAELAPGSADEEVLQRARRGSAVIITGDKDFGELVYRRKRANAGTSGFPEEHGSIKICMREMLQDHKDYACLAEVVAGMTRTIIQDAECNKRFDELVRE